MEQMEKMSKEAALEKIGSSKDGSLRSLALNSVTVFKELKIGGSNPDGKAWDFAKGVREKFGDNFTAENAKKHFRELYLNPKPGKSAPTSKKPSASGRSNESKAAKTDDIAEKDKHILDSEISKNEKIRKLIKKHYSISTIAAAMGLKYQRVKNIKKAMDKSEEN